MKQSTPLERYISHKGGSTSLQNMSTRLWAAPKTKEKRGSMPCILFFLLPISGIPSICSLHILPKWCSVSSVFQPCLTHPTLGLTQGKTVSSLHQGFSYSTSWEDLNFISCGIYCQNNRVFTLKIKCNIEHACCKLCINPHSQILCGPLLIIRARI